MIHRTPMQANGEQWKLLLVSKNIPNPLHDNEARNRAMDEEGQFGQLWGRGLESRTEWTAGHLKLRLIKRFRDKKRMVEQWGWVQMIVCWPRFA